MALQYFYITNDAAVASICEKAGVDRIFIDMEYIGKDRRQAGLNSVKNHHTVEDVRNIRACVKKSKILVRVNPVHAASAQEIDAVVDAGADYIMLPMWKTAEDVKTFLSLVGGRAKTMLLLETEEARQCLDEVLHLPGIDEMYIGLNDLHLSQHKKFMFELFTDGTVDEIVSKVKKAGIPFGIGGVGRVNCPNLLPAENILCEHYRLGSSMVILSRTFCDWTQRSTADFEKIITRGIAENRAYEHQIAKQNPAFFAVMHRDTAQKIAGIRNNR